MKHTQRRKICDSWYHQKWFRILLVIVGIDMIILGGTFVLGLNIINLIENTHIFLRIIGGLAYIIVAVFIIHYALLYDSIRQKTYILCQHCAHVQKEKDDE